MAERAAPRTVVAVTLEKVLPRPVLERAAALAGEDARVVLYDLDAAGTFASPRPTNWSGEGEEELTGFAPLPPEELEVAGRAAIAAQVRDLRARGVDAWGWLPDTPGPRALAAFAHRVGAVAVLVPPEAVERLEGGRPDFEIVGPGPAPAA